MLKIVNIVATTNVKCLLDITDLARTLDLSFNPHRFSGASLRLEKCTILLFRTGKLVIVGAKNIEECSDAAKTIQTMLEALDYPAQLDKITVTNMVGSGCMKQAINLPKLWKTLSNNGYRPSYEPELFPGLINRTGNSTVTVFTSGKFNIVGAKTVQQLEMIHRKLLPFLEEAI